MISRRGFIDTLAVGAAGLAVSSTAKSYGQILGSNERLNFAVIGLHGRAYAHLSSLKANQKEARITHVCDVESNFLQKFAAASSRLLGTRLRATGISARCSLRRMLTQSPLFALCQKTRLCRCETVAGKCCMVCSSPKCPRFRASSV